MLGPLFLTLLGQLLVHLAVSSYTLAQRALKRIGVNAPADNAGLAVGFLHCFSVDAAQVTIDARHGKASQLVQDILDALWPNSIDLEPLIHRCLPIVWRPRSTHLVPVALG